MNIEFPGCSVQRLDNHILTTFEDGATSANWPHPDDAFYVQIAGECGFTDLMSYCHAHEVCHSAVPHHLFDRHGYVPWMAAHGRKMNIAAAMAEERLIYYVQRAACGATPVLDDQWYPVLRLLAEHKLCGATQPAPLPRWF